MSKDNQAPRTTSPTTVASLAEQALLRAARAVLSPPDGDDKRPLLLFLAGPNGAGKTSFFKELDAQGPGRSITFVNADLIAGTLRGLPAADVLAQKMADLIREHMLAQRASFATETVFSDEVGAKLDFLARSEAAGYRVVLIYTSLAAWPLSRERVAYRVNEEKGHDVPTHKLQRRFIASRENCRRALYKVEAAILLDNSSRENPLRVMAVLSRGKVLHKLPHLPSYIADLLPIGDGLEQAAAPAAPMAEPVVPKESTNE